MQKFWNFIIPLFQNKYTLAGSLFLVWIVFFDNNNLINRFSMIRNLNKLKADKTYYEEKIKNDRQKMKELMTDDESLEKFAREQYLMKKPNEEIFVVEE